MKSHKTQKRNLPSKRRALFHLGLDAVMLFASIIVVTSTVWSVEHLLTSESVRLGVPIAIGVLAYLVWEGIYERDQVRRWGAALASVTRAVVVGATAFSLVGFVVAIGEGARRWVVIVAIVWYVLLALHHGVRAALGSNRSRVIIAGSPAKALEMWEVLSVDRSRSHHVLGFVADDASNGSGALGSLEDLPALAESHGADQVIFCLDGMSGGRFAPLARMLSRQGVDVALTGLGDVAPRRVVRSHIMGRPIIAITPSKPADWQLGVKRVVDVAVSAFLLLVLSPLLAAVAIAIRVIDGVSPIFCQPRVGKGGDLFTIYKFQTMVLGAEELKIDLTNELDGPMFKMEADPRVTKLGRILRKTSIDELPQLINVIKGDMSLVGPRPFVESEVVAAPQRFREREAVTPGMTGHWQVSGRSDTDFDELDELDRWYVDNWSLGEDLGILAKTVPAVLRQKGAK